MALKIRILFAVVCIAALISMSEAAPQRKANNDVDYKAILEDAKKQMDDLVKQLEDLEKFMPEIRRHQDFNREFTGVLGLPPKVK